MIAFHFGRFIQIRIGSFLLASLSNYQIEILGEAAVLVCLNSSYRNSLCKAECLTQQTPKRHHFSVVIGLECLTVHPVLSKLGFFSQTRPLSQVLDECAHENN